MNNIKLCSGFGAKHTSKNKPLDTALWDEITTMVDYPQNVEKSKSQWVICSTLLSRQAKAQEANGEYWMLWADIDKNPPTISELAAIMERTLKGSCFEIYTTKSATEDAQKSRVLIPLEKSLSPLEWQQCQLKIYGHWVREGVPFHT